MLRQTIRTFCEVRDGVVRIVRTDPVLTPITEKRKREGGDTDAEGGAGTGTEKAL